MTEDYRIVRGPPKPLPAYVLRPRLHVPTTRDSLTGKVHPHHAVCACDRCEHERAEYERKERTP
jgi:hypothetical protein